MWSVIAEQLADAHREHVLGGGVPLDDRARQRLGQQVFDALLGLGPLERYLAHPEVEELLVNGRQQAFVLRAGGTKVRVNTGFGSEAELRAFAARTVAVAGRRLDEANPKADARLPDGSRLHAICPPLTPFTCLTIRRHRLLAHTIEDLLALGTLTRRGRRAASGGGAGRVQPAHLRGDRVGQDHHPERDRQPDPGRPAGHHHRGNQRARPGAPPGGLHRPGGPVRQPGRRRRDPHPRAGPPGAADATGPDHRRGGPRPRSPRHAERHELRP